jgi:serine/threonine protein kinase
MNELKTLKTIVNPNVVQCEQLWQDKNNYYIVSECCIGGDLHKRLVSKEDGKFTEDDTGNIVYQILDAINYMHFTKGISHRDMKPENVMMVSNKPDDLEVKVTDFGFSCFSDCGSTSKLELGTLPFMAPELVA